MYVFLADVIAAIHVGYVLAVLVGLVLILVGKAVGWRWVGNRWFRLIHLGMIVIVILRAAIWDACPLTWWEQDLRTLGGQVDYEGSPVGKFLHDLIHFNAPLWVFQTAYVCFGLLVAAAFWLVPVRWREPRGTSA